MLEELLTKEEGKVLEFKVSSKNHSNYCGQVPLEEQALG